MSVLAAIAVLALLIVVHELGHFIAARSQGIHVNRFSLGFGPILWKYQGAETEYAIRAFPLGGFVGFPDDDPDSKISPEDPNLLRNRPVLDRAIVISAGVIANLIFAYFLLVTQAGIVGIPQLHSQPGVIIASVFTEENAPSADIKPEDVALAAAKAGIKPRDVVLAAEGKKLGAAQEALESLTRVIQQHPNQPLTLLIQREDEKPFNLTVTPEQARDGKGRIGVQLAPNGKLVRHPAANVVDAFYQGAAEFQRIAILTVQGFEQLISNFSQTASQVAGPVKIVEIGAGIAHSDASSLFQFAALISINLAIINILPLPALDGGQLAFLLIEGLRGKPLPTHIQDGVMQTGLMVLLGLGIFLIVRDTANLPWIQQLF
ncbi:MAG: RIP metalloprotease RseP [Chroococcidiopsidaceae cyanobacterium CP_BM_ER_R8_30]|nr:RIP metalloprotease RseP [Chroococcidiopsidaceae cyanobacterium CP_BM_ER_R8_30]